jgi:kinesin family protein C2/C3
MKYEVFVQMIEIYNEQVRDLLISDGSNRRYPLSKQCFYDNSFLI